MIKWKPTKEECHKMLSYKLAVVVTPESERVLIGTMRDIVAALSGNETAELIYDHTFPFGYYLLHQEYDPDWNTMLSLLEFGENNLDESTIERYLHRNSSKITRERIFEDFLRDKCKDQENPYTMYVAIRIWYRYWLIRSSLKDERQAFFNSANNLVRPFTTQNNTCIQKVIITPDNPIFKDCREFEIEDCVSVMYTPMRRLISEYISNPSVQCLLLENSLLPLTAHYKTQIQLQPKYLIQCRMCNTLFLRKDLRSDLCSDACKAKAVEENNARRMEDSVTADIEKTLNNVRGHWTRRLQRIKESPDWTDEKVEIYAQAFRVFKQEAIVMRQKHKDGKITLKEYKDWLFEQQEKARSVQEEIKGI